MDADADAERLFIPDPGEREMLIVGVVGCFVVPPGREPRERRLLLPLCTLGGAMKERKDYIVSVCVY